MCFFFSFLGLIVSVLGRVLRLPFTLWPPALGINDSCGMSLTSSVSTVIFLDELSPDVCPPRPPNLSVELDCLLCRSGGGGGGAAMLDRLVLVLTLPLSLPLSLAALWLDVTLLDVTSAVLFCEAICDVAVSSNFRMAATRPGRGVFGWLTSCTVSRVEEPLLGPRAGVLIPDDR